MSDGIRAFSPISPALAWATHDSAISLHYRRVGSAIPLRPNSEGRLAKKKAERPRDQYSGIRIFRHHRSLSPTSNDVRPARATQGRPGGCSPGTTVFRDTASLFGFTQNGLSYLS